MITYKRGSRGEMVLQIQKALAGAGLKVIQDGIYGVITEEAVSEFQKKKGITVDGIVGPKTLTLLIPCRFKKSKRTITEIIVHCSATPEGKDFTVDDIRLWHKQRGFNDVGYHYVIYRNGHLVNGRDVDTIGAHCTNHNVHSIGICYIGGVAKDGKTPKDTRTLTQKAVLLSLLTDLKKIYPNAKIYGHRDFANKECPSFDATKEYRNV